jgi:hypothetical protein
MAAPANGPGELYDALCRLPPNVVGAIVEGEVHASPRPAAPHARVASQLGGAVLNESLAVSRS